MRLPAIDYQRLNNRTCARFSNACTPGCDSLYSPARASRRRAACRRSAAPTVCGTPSSSSSSRRRRLSHAIPAGVGVVRLAPSDDRQVRAQPGASRLASWSERPEFTLITQNVDGLHERAGTREVVHRHGSIWEVCVGAARQPHRRVGATTPRRIQRSLHAARIAVI